MGRETLREVEHGMYGLVSGRGPAHHHKSPTSWRVAHIDASVASSEGMLGLTRYIATHVGVV